MSSQKSRNKQKKNNIKVLVRCRPLLEFQNQPAWQISSLNKIQCMHTKSVRQKFDKTNRRSQADIQQKFRQINFQFEKVFQQNITSEKIYKQQAKQMVAEALKKAKNLTLMCYGQTCSGKTFTILGQEKFPGLMPCILRDLTIFKTQFASCQLKMSYFEIYNENIYDLLLDGGRRNSNSAKLKIYQDKIYGWQVAGLKKESIQNFQDCIEIIEKGQKNRAYASKQNHQRSSRSHTILRIYIEREDNKYNKKHQIFNIVDLAGSERLTQLSKNTQQTASINKSLFQLSNVISKLSANVATSHIPYRDSKLTKLLQFSLNGQSNCLIMFCISPAVESFHQSLSTLRLAKKAKIIQIDNQEEDLTLNWSTTQRQLFQTKQMLAKKNAECEQLTIRLDYLSKQLERLEYQFDQMENRSSAHVNLFILLDHQNFVIKNANKLISESFSSFQKDQNFQHELDEYKNQFNQSLQQLYEQYTSDVCHLYLKKLHIKQKHSKQYKKQSCLLKLQDICYMDLIFDQKLKNICKFQSLDRVLKDLQDNLGKQNEMSLSNVKTKEQNESVNSFIQLVKQYQSILKKSKDSKISKENSYRMSYQSAYQKNYKRRDLSNQIYSSNTKFIKSSIIVPTKNSAQGKTLYSWGCSKDGRVFKGTNILSGINSLQNQIYGTIKQIRTNYNHNIIITENGKIYGWGKNNFNQISSKNTPAHSLPRQINIKDKIKSVATGWGHSLALSYQGNIYSWGYGQNGQLGHGNLENISKPKLLQTQIKCSEVFAGHSHSAFLDQDRKLYTFGFNKDYRCLIKTEDDFIISPKILALNKIKQVSLGLSHSAVLTEQNYIFCGGIGSNGQFGKQMSLDASGCQYVSVQNRKFEQNDKKIQKICPLTQFEFNGIDNQYILDIKCGQNQTYLLSNYGNLFLCGKNFNKKNDFNIYQPKMILSNVLSFSIGSRHGFAFSSNSNKIYGWGFNMYNQLGNDKENDAIVPEVIQGVSSLNITAIQCGFIHTIGLGK